MDENMFVNKKIKSIKIVNIDYINYFNAEACPYIEIGFYDLDINLYIVALPQVSNVVFLETDEDINYYIGCKFLGVEFLEVCAKFTNVEKFSKEYGDDDIDVNVSFINIITTAYTKLDIKGYAIHNGYYAGFDIEFRYGTSYENSKKLESKYTYIGSTTR